MRGILLLTIMLTATFASQAQNEWKFEVDHHMEMTKGEIRQVSDDVWVIVPSGTEGKQYLPHNLPDAAKVDGLKVKFSGYVGVIPPYYKMMGTPFYVESLKARGCKAKKAIGKGGYEFAPPKPHIDEAID